MCIIVAAIIFLIIAVYDEDGCLSCGKRESWACWFAVIFLVLAMLIATLGLLAALATSFGEDKEAEVVKDLELKEYNQVN